MQININSKLFSTTNIIVALSLVVILLMVYLKNNNFELFATENFIILELIALTFGSFFLLPDKIKDVNFESNDKSISYGFFIS